MDQRTFLSVLIVSVLVVPNVSQYYGNNYYPNMRVPSSSMSMPSPMMPPVEQIAMARPMSGYQPAPGPVQEPMYSDEYEDDDQPKYHVRKRIGRMPSVHDADYEDPPALPPPPPNLVLVPYPYALVVPNLQNFSNTTKGTETTRREETTTKSTTKKSIATTTTTTTTTSITTQKPCSKKPTTKTPTTKKPISRSYNRLKDCKSEGGRLEKLEDCRPTSTRLQDFRPVDAWLDDRRPVDARLENRRPERARLEDLRSEGTRLKDRLRLEGLKPEDFNNMRTLRKTKAWMPKYGIVPIPDNLAEKLMSQLRDVKTLQLSNRRMISKYDQYGLI